jgi:ABC-type nickel/cobalt efflux system permease component RcnA
MSLRLSVRVAAAFALAFSTVALVVPQTSAHPLGNFTINHYSELRVATDAVLIDHVTDYAEIPTFSERRQMDTDGDGDVSAAEATTFEAARCASLATQLHLSEAGSLLPLETVQSGLSFPMGQGSVTMRLVCVYRAALATEMAAAATFAFEDVSYAERQGWREIVVRGDGTTLENSDAPTTGTSDRLTHYPSDLLSIPLGQSEASFGALPGGPVLEPFSVPDASPVGALAAEQPVGDPQPAAPAEPEPAPAISAPAGVTELGSDITALFQSPDLTPPIIALSLLVAVALGAFHAVSPGHGKTVMAAYLVGSRGNMRHAVGLGLTVTVSHTLGVLALGALSLSAAALIPPERLYPILSVVSGAIVVVIGSYLLVTRLRSMYVSRREAREHGAAHEHGVEHEHGHHHSASSSEVVRPAGWHEHDGMGHTHLPSEGIGRRGLFALGLSGGMVPSVSALLILIGSISIGRPAFGIVLTIAFGLGMAFVLVGVGLALVYARRFVERFPAATPLRLSQRLPLVTAVIVLVAGLLIAGQGLSALG